MPPLLRLTIALLDSASKPKAQQLCDCVRSNGILDLYVKAEEFAASEGSNSTGLQQASREMGVIIDKCNAS
jgi:hypothetical protein